MGPQTKDAVLKHLNTKYRTMSVKDESLRQLLRIYFKRVDDDLWGIKDYGLLPRSERNRNALLKHGKVSESCKTVWCLKYQHRLSFEHCIECGGCEGAFGEVV